MNPSSLDLRYHSHGPDSVTRYQVDVLNDGQLVVHTAIAADGRRTQLISAWGGPHALNTLHKLDVRVLRGPVSIAVPGAKPREFKSTGRMTLEPGAAFSIEADGFAQLACTPKPGPGFGHGSSQPCVLE